MTFRILLSVAVAAAGAPITAVAQSSDTLRLSLAQAEAHALQGSPLLAEPTASLHLAQARRTQAAHAGILPSFTLRNINGFLPRARGEFTPTGVLVSPDTSTGLNDLRPFTEIEVNFVQPLYTFGKTGGAKDAAAFGVAAGQAGVEASRNEIRQQVRALYWGVVLAGELQRIIEDARKEVQRARDKINEKLREESEEVSQNDLFKLDVFQYEVDKRMREAVEKMELARSGLNGALGLPPGVVVVPVDSVLSPLAVTLDSLETYVGLAAANRPELAQLGAGIQARNALVRSASSDYYPQLFLGGQVKINRANDRFDSNNPFVNNPTNYFRAGLIVGLNWNLNFFQTGDRSRVARFEEAALTARLPAVRAGIRLDVEKAYRSVVTAIANVRDSEAALTSTDNWLRAEAQTFDLGLGEIKDFIDAFRANSTMRAEHAENVAKLNVALAALGKAAGRDLYPR